MIKSKKKFVNYVFTMLGYPIINVEIDKSLIKEVINDVVGLYKAYVSGDSLSDVEIYNNPIVKNMVVANCKKVWGEILSKYNPQFPDGIILNSEYPRQKGSEEFDYWFDKMVKSNKLQLVLG